MSLQEILYGVLIVSVVVITVTLVWVANDLKGLLRSLRRSAEDTETVTREIKEKVLMLAEALDRAGAAAASVIGLIETAIDQIKEKRDSIAQGIGLVTGVGRAIKERRQPEADNQAQEEAEEDKEEKIEEVVKAKDVDVSDEKVETKQEKSKDEDKKSSSKKKDESKTPVDTVSKA